MAMGVNSSSRGRGRSRRRAAMAEIRRRSGGSGTGFDAIGMMVVDMANDGSPVRVVDEPPVPFTYDAMVRRVAHEYAANFSRI